MIYLTQSDILTQLDECLVQDVLDGKDYRLDEAERYSIELAKSYLAPRYETEILFTPYVSKEDTDPQDYFEGMKLITESTSGNISDIVECVGTNGTGGFVIEPDCRNYMLKDIILSITIFSLERVCAYRQIPIYIVDKHDFSIELLKEINRGRVSIDLPYKSEDTIENQQGFGIMYGKSSNSDYNDY